MDSPCWLGLELVWLCVVGRKLPDRIPDAGDLDGD
jgi:hypothetical protein